MKQTGKANKPICIIPARGGSKRIANKNIKLFCGRPMLQWSLEAAISSDCFSTVVVSTDSEEIALVAEGLGARVPFMRPSHLADDYTITIDVIRHAVESLRQLDPQNINDYTPVCCLYATSPFTQASDIVGSLDLLTDSQFVVPVTSFAFPIQRASKMDEEGTLSLFSPEHVNTRSQDLEEAYHDAGQFYWATANTWCTVRSIYERAPLGFPLPRWRVQDIDTPEDWQRAELMFASVQQKPDDLVNTLQLHSA